MAAPPRVTNPIIRADPGPRGVDGYGAGGLALHAGGGALHAPGSTGTHVGSLSGAPSKSPYAQGTHGLPVTVTRKPGTAKHKAVVKPVHHTPAKPSGGRGVTHKPVVKKPAPKAASHKPIPAPVVKVPKPPTATSSPVPTSYSGAGSSIWTSSLGSYAHVLVLIGGALLLWYLVSHRNSITRSVKGGA